jgi:26S proteasome regulatory subunit N5
MEGGRSGAASGGQLEEKVDWTAETDQKIPQAESLAAAGQLSEALALLANLEKKCRVGNDNASLVRICKSSLELCFAAKDVDALISSLETLSTRRSQKTAAVRALVQTALPWCVVEPYEPLAVANDTEKKNRDRLVECLRVITDGKIFLEKERAQLTRALSKIKVRRIIFPDRQLQLFAVYIRC